MTIRQDEITHEELKRLISYDPLTGKFVRRVTTGMKTHVGQVVGTQGPRPRISFNRRDYRASRLAWFYVHGKWPDGVVDHINGDPTDNRLENLRDVSQRVNRENQRVASSYNKNSGLLGVRAGLRGKWDAVIHVKGKPIYIGRFATPEIAHAAYIAAKRVFHEGCTL